MAYEDSFENFEWLSQYAPCFEISSSQIEIIYEPKEFYRRLKNEFSESKSRILVSSYYIGTSEFEKELIESIEHALKNSDVQNTKILLDYSRGLRGKINSKKMLQHLKPIYKERFHIYLYHTPNLRGIAKMVLPERWNETLGILHMKVYIADDNLIISGANLSQDYFVNRQDRYICIKNCKHLCDFFEKLINVMSEYSFEVDENGDCLYNNHQHPCDDDKDEFFHQLSSSIKSLLKEYSSLNSSTLNDTNEDDKVRIYPLLQLNHANLFVDELVTMRLFEYALKNSRIYIGAGYFNLVEEYKATIVENSKAEYHILLPSPEANGFHNAHGLSSNIPKVYSNIEEKFFKSILTHKQDERIYLHEYKRDNWTFHAKGLWYYPINSELPNLTIIGSSNFGYRSVKHDLEAQLAIYTNNEKLQKELNEEKNALFQPSYVVTSETFQTETRYITLFVEFLTRMLHKFF